MRSDRCPVMAETVAGMAFERHDAVRIGIVGTGHRATSLMHHLVAIEGTEITHVYDVVEENAQRARALVLDADADPPVIDRDLDSLLGAGDVDLVCVATPWDDHTPTAVAAMEAGKHVAVEVPAAVSLEDCWALVEASERSRRHCIMLENCRYGYNELLVRNMVRAGMFGELVHGEAAYIHDLREQLMTGPPWRRRAHIERDGNLYPTHGLGPIAMYMGINAEDRFDTLVSMSSAARGLAEWRAAHLGAADEAWRESYRCGDINTSIIKTAKGRTILLQHQIVTPRPYDRLNLISGTRGVFQDFPPRIYLDGQEGPEEYTDLTPYRQRFEDELWRGRTAAELGSHGGADYIMLTRLISTMRCGEAPDMDVYDAASWSAPGPLSEQSVAAGGASMRFPNFQRAHLSQPEVVDDAIR